MDQPATRRENNNGKSQWSWLSLSSPYCREMSVLCLRTSSINDQLGFKMLLDILVWHSLAIHHFSKWLKQSVVYQGFYFLFFYEGWSVWRQMFGTTSVYHMLTRTKAMARKCLCESAVTLKYIVLQLVGLISSQLLISGCRLLAGLCSINSEWTLWRWHSEDCFANCSDK